MSSSSKEPTPQELTRQRVQRYGQLVRTSRERKGFSIEEFARRTGLTVSYLQHLEGQQLDLHGLSTSVVQKIATALGERPESLVVRSGLYMKEIPKRRHSASQ